jgi:hypothetical protein
VNASLNPQSIIDRSMGFLRLDDPTYEEVEHDASATTQAAVVVAVVALAAAIGGLGEGGLGFVAGFIVAIVSWVITSYAIFLIGTRLWPSTSTQADVGQLLRVVGFASVAGIVNVLGFIPVLGPILALVAGIWGIVMTVKGVKHALEMSTGRAIVTAVAGWILAAIIGAIIFAILGVDVGVSA